MGHIRSQLPLLLVLAPQRHRHLIDRLNQRHDFRGVKLLCNLRPIITLGNLLRDLYHRADGFGKACGDITAKPDRGQ